MADLNLGSLLKSLATGGLLVVFVDALCDLGLDQWLEEFRGIEGLLALANYLC